MKTFIAYLITSLVALPVMGQLAGLPVADSAAPIAQNTMRVSAGVVLEDDINLYGGRFTFGVMDGLAVFAGGGIVDPDHGDAGWAIQGGGIFALPIQDLPVDLALRGTAGYASLDQEYRTVRYNPLTMEFERTTATVDIDIITLNAGVLASMPVIDALAVYGYFGLNHTRTKAGSYTDSDTDLAIGGGGIFSLTHQISLYAELMHIDELWIGAGGRFEF